MRVLITKKITRTPRLPKLFQRKHIAIIVSVLVMFFIASSVYSQTIRVKGHVSDEKGQPVQKVSVLVKGTTNGVSGDDNGNFELNAPSNGTLVISAVNFTTQEVRIGGKQTLSITLISFEKTESEVVVVGYGTQRRKDITGSVASVSGATLKEVPAPNVIAQLKGRTAGVDIVSNSATPGGGGQIRIRGNRSMARSAGESDGLDQPLIVLDGIPFSGSVNDINPEDIASLDIVKDASGTAVYGSRGSGGVIYITTKRGKVGKAVMSYDAYYGISSVMGNLKVFTGPEFAQFKADAATYNRATPNTTAYGMTVAEQAALAAGISTNWQDLIYKNGFTTSHQLGLSGGNEATLYSLSGGYYNETGIIPNQKFERYSLRTTIDHKINNRLKIGLNTLNTLSYSNTPGGSGVPGGLVRTTPLAAAYNADGTVNINPQIGSTDFNAVSPLTLITKKGAILARNRRLRTFNSLYGEVQIIKDLKYRLNLGLDYSQSQGDGYNGPLTYTNSSTSQAGSNASVSNSESWSYTVENLLTYNKTFLEKHSIGFTGLFSAQKSHNQSSSFNATGVPADYIQNANLNLANSVTANNGNFSESGLLSLMARVNYGYDNRYLFTASIRRDGASTLSPGHQYYTYPAFSAGWNIKNEQFMNNISCVSNLKLRGGWGKTSNQGVAPYSTLGLLSTSTYNFGQGAGGQQAAYTVTSLANNALHWESTSESNIGLDFGVFKNRLTGSIDIYSQKTSDILLQVSLPPSNGAGSTLKNLGKTKGHGMEISLSSINVQTKTGLTWSTDLNFYFNREEITQLTTPAQLNDLGNGWFVGQPLTVIYDLKKIGIWQTADSAKGLTAAQTSPVQFPGQIRIQDLNGDNKIDQNDRQIIGNFQPRWEGGLTNRVTYKNFDFSIVIYARMGMKVLVPYVTADGGAQGFPFFMQSRNNQLKVDYWTRSNPTNEFPAPDASTDRFLFGSTLGYMDGSFIKCRSINLGYEVPTKILAKAHINSLRVYVTALNPFIIFSPFVRDGFGPDPEGNGYGGSVTSPNGGGSIGAGGTQGNGRQISVNANNPATRQFNIGINLRF